MRGASRTRGRRVLAAVAAGALVVGTAWLLRATLLRGVGAALVAEDPLERVELTFLAYAAERGAALEASRLYAEGRTARVATATWPVPPLDDELRALGVPILRPTELALRVLERGRVPSNRVDLLPVVVYGTGDEARVLASHVRERGVASVCYVTARNHTARSRWILARELPAHVRLVVRSPRDDPFSADGWWRRRALAREVAMEYLRWANTLLLGDAWAASPERAR